MYLVKIILFNQSLKNLPYWLT